MTEFLTESHISSEEKIDISDACYHNYMKTQIKSDDDLPLEKNIKHTKCNNIYWIHFQEQL